MLKLFTGNPAIKVRIKQIVHHVSSINLNSNYTNFILDHHHNFLHLYHKHASD